jgi:CheY-like chemotaxis protein
MASVVVCDDDSILRGVVSGLCEEAGLEVVAETDRAHDALELVQRFGVDVLVLDLVLADGSSEHLLTQLATQEPATEVIVFTAFTSEAARLVRAGARAVVEKPDFEALGKLLAGVAEGTEIDLRDASADERRQAGRAVAEVPDLWHSPSGVASTYDLKRSLLHVIEGDSVLVVALKDLDALAATVGPTLAADCHLALARMLREAMRVQDIVHEAPDPGGFIALLRGGDGRAASATWTRLVELFDASEVPGRLSGAHSRVDGVGGADAVARALGALRSMAPGESSAGPASDALLLSA